MWLPYKITFVVLQILSLPLISVLFLLLFLYSQLVRLSARIFQDFVGPIGSSGSVYLGDAIYEKPHATLLQGTELYGDCTKESIVKEYQRAYDYTEKDGKRCYRELGYHLVRYGGYGFWKEIPNFKIHCVSFVETASSAPDEEEVNAIAERLHRQPFERDGPLWSAHLVRNYKGDPKRTFQIFRFHHLLADAASFLKLFYCITGSLELPKSFTKPGSSVTKWKSMEASYLERALTFSSLLTFGFIDYVNQVLLEQDKHGLHFGASGKLKIAGDWRSINGRRMDVGVLRSASKAHGCSMVHILMVGVSKGVENYLVKYHGNEPFPKGFNFAVSLPMPNHPNMRLTNHWCLAKMYSKTGIEQTPDSLQYFKEETARAAKNSLPLISAFTFKFVCGLLPTQLVDQVTKARATCTVSFSSIVGPQDEQRLMAGCKLVDQFAWPPIQQESMALAIGVLSCNGKLRIGITADVGCIPTKSRLHDLEAMINDAIMNMCQQE